MRKILYFLIVTLVACSPSQKKSADQAAEMPRQWISYSTKDSIPTAFNHYYAKRFKTEFVIADSNQPYNATDVLMDSLPTKQLRLLAKSDSEWRITFIQGGFVKHYVFLDFTLNGDSVRNFRMAKSYAQLENLDTINRYLSENKINFTVTDSIDH